MGGEYAPFCDTPRFEGVAVRLQESMCGEVYAIER